ncbi:MAG TPA: DUF4384 domain-containing protein [Pyrinomonadaceae bacterium]|jgi:hypothetical protein
MRLRTPLALAAAAAMLTCAAATRAQQQQSGPQKDEQVIEEFVTTRGVIFDTSAKKSSKQSGQASAASSRKSGAAGKHSSAGAAPGGVASNKGGKGGGRAGAQGKSNKASAQRPAAGVTADAGVQASDEAGAQLLKASAGGARRALALGYTILTKDAAGRLSVVDAAREFRTGDNIAIALEANADGYLYMFNASDGKNPEMLFPNVQLDGGANSLAAHARATFPADPSLDFRFTDPPAREHLFVIFSREPLPGVPTGEALAEFCGANVEDCAWKPTAAQWERIRGGGGVKGRGVTEARNTQLAKASAPPVAPLTLQRGLKVKREDPRPGVVRVNNSPDADILVTEIILAHK